MGQQGIAHQLGGLLLRPVAHARERHHLERAGDLGDRALEQQVAHVGVVVGPRDGGGHGDGWQLGRGLQPVLRRDVGPVVLEGSRHGTGAHEGVFEDAALLGRERAGGCGVEYEGLEVGGVVLEQPLLGDAGELEQQHVPALLLLLGHLAALGACHRVGRVEDEQRAHHLRPKRRGGPAQAAAPVVTREVGRLEAQALHETDDIANKQREGVVLGALRSVALAVAAHVGDDGPVAGACKRRGLSAPRVAKLREAVPQDDRGAVGRAHLLHRQRGRAGVHCGALGARDVSQRAHPIRRRARPGRACRQPRGQTRCRPPRRPSAAGWCRSCPGWC